MVMGAERSSSSVFSWIRITISPLPNVGADTISIQEALSVADTGQCACVTTPISLVDRVEGTVRDDRPAAYVQGALACCTTKSRPAILNVVERAAPLFDWTVIVEVPGPARLVGFADTHAGVPVTLHSQPTVVVTVTEMLPPVDVVS